MRALSRSYAQIPQRMVSERGQQVCYLPVAAGDREYETSQCVRAMECLVKSGTTKAN